MQAYLNRALLKSISGCCYTQVHLVTSSHVFAITYSADCRTNALNLLMISCFLMSSLVGKPNAFWR
jgi:hypothetical protein